MSYLRFEFTRYEQESSLRHGQRLKFVRSGEGSATARSLYISDYGDMYSVAFRHFRLRRHSGLLCKNLRGSIPVPHVPLSTLQICRCQHIHMTRGQCGSLRLHRTGLPPATPRQLSVASEEFLALPLRCYIFTN